MQTLLETRELNANEKYTEFANKIALLAPGDIPTHGNSYDVEVTAPDGGVNMRCGAGVEYDKVLPDMIPNGTVLTVTKEAVASNGNSWGYTNYNGTYGWIAVYYRILLSKYSFTVSQQKSELSVHWSRQITCQTISR